MIDDSWRAFRAEEEDAHRAWQTGDTGPIKALWAHDGDVSIFGGLGGLEQGWDLVRPRLDWAAARVAGRGGRFVRETLVERVGTEIAYTVDIEKTLAPESEEVISTRRVTQIYLRLGKSWLTVHRHADLSMQQGGP